MNGVRLVPLLVDAGHVVAGMTRSPGKAAKLEALGAEPVVCDVYERDALRDAAVAFGPDSVMHQLTDLPDDASRISEFGERNDRIRREGTQNLLAAAAAVDVERFYAQSIAWERGAANRTFECTVLDAGGVVIRYGQLYGPGTYYETEPPSRPRIEIDEAARRTIPVLGAASGVVELVE